MPMVVRKVSQVVGLLLLISTLFLILEREFVYSRGS